VFAEDLGWQFNSLARESWRLVLLFILTELKRGFTHCLKEKSALHHAAAAADTGPRPGTSSGSSGGGHANSDASPLPALPSNSFSSTVGNCRDVGDDVTDDDRNGGAAAEVTQE